MTKKKNTHTHTKESKRRKKKKKGGGEEEQRWTKLAWEIKIRKKEKKVTYWTKSMCKCICVFLSFTYQTLPTLYSSHLALTN